MARKIFDKKIVQSPSIATKQRGPKGRNSPLHVTREGGLSLFGSHGKGASTWVSHFNTRVQIEVKDSLSQKNFQLFSKQIFFMFQDYGMSFDKQTFFDKNNCSKSQYRNEATRSQRQKLPFACFQRRGTLPVRIAWQGGWHLGVSLRYESTNRGQKFFKSKNFSTFFKTDFLHVSRLWKKFWQEKFLTKKIVQSPSIATRSQRQKLPFACYQRRGTLPVRIAWQGG